MSTYVIQEGGERWRLLAQLPPAELAAIKKKSWKWTNRLPVVLLLFSLPPLGLYLLWKSERFSRRAQWMLTVVGAFFTLGALPLPSSDDHRAAPARSKAAATPTPRQEPQQVKPEQLAAAPQAAESLLREMEELLSQIEQTNQLLLSDGYTGQEFRIVARRLRIKSNQVAKRVQEFVENPVNQKSPFSGIGGTVGHSLKSSAMFLKVATLDLAWMLDSNNQLEQGKQEALHKNIGNVRYEFANVKKGLDSLTNPEPYEAAANEEKTIRAKARVRMKQRMSEFPSPRANSTAQPFTVVESRRRTTSNGGFIDEIIIASPMASCVEEYIQTTMKAAKDHAAIRGVNRVDCILLPSAASDPIFTLAITRYEPAKSGNRAWEVQATKAVYTEQEIAIMEAWKTARAKVPSQQSEEIEAFIVKSGTATYEDIWAIPTPYLDEVAPIF